MKFKFENIKETSYYDKCSAENALYCELSYKRHASSFAGMVFEFIDVNSKVTYNSSFDEQILKNIDRYDNLRIGCDDVYIKSITDKYRELNPSIGIKIHFLVYSDVRSSQMIFERLIELILFLVDKEMIYIK
ncbi:MAG: hypothetical protein IJ065_02160 [Eubacterium sp.]|nr:hypothetical protein [Eubacterium sp.]